MMFRLVPIRSSISTGAEWIFEAVSSRALLEEAHIKLSSLISDLLGASAGACCRGLGDGKRTPRLWLRRPTWPDNQLSFPTSAGENGTWLGVECEQSTAARVRARFFKGETTPVTVQTWLASFAVFDAALPLGCFPSSPLSWSTEGTYVPGAVAVPPACGV
jgi:hypothetical protein